MSSYRFKMPPTRPTFGSLPEADYDFVVSDCLEPYQSAAGNMVLAVKLSIQPEGTIVFANPWTGTDKHGTERDGIAEFLICVNRAPKPGEEPLWRAIVGARGRCHLKVEIAAKGALVGKEVNKVAYFYAPKQIGPSAQAEQIRAKAVKKAGGPSEDDPDEIPF